MVRVPTEHAARRNYGERTRDTTASYERTNCVRHGVIAVTQCLDADTYSEVTHAMSHQVHGIDHRGDRKAEAPTA